MAMLLVMFSTIPTPPPPPLPQSRVDWVVLNKTIYHTNENKQTNQNRPQLIAKGNYWGDV